MDNCHRHYFFFRYLYYFLKSENVHKKELLNVLEDLLTVDPTSELSEEYCKLVTNKTGEWISLNITAFNLFYSLSLNEDRFIYLKISEVREFI